MCQGLAFFPITVWDPSNFSGHAGLSGALLEPFERRRCCGGQSEACLSVGFLVQQALGLV